MKCFLFGHVYNKYQIRSHDNQVFEIKFICSRCNHKVLYKDITYNNKENNKFNDLIEKYLIEQTLRKFL